MQRGNKSQKRILTAPCVVLLGKSWAHGFTKGQGMLCSECEFKSSSCAHPVATVLGADHGRPLGWKQRLYWRDFCSPGRLGVTFSTLGGRLIKEMGPFHILDELASWSWTPRLPGPRCMYAHRFMIFCFHSPQPNRKWMVRIQLLPQLPKTVDIVLELGRG